MIRCEHCHTGHKKQNKHEPSSLSLSLSFEDICPQWNNALITRFSNDSRLNILEAKYCIVGEAHGFRNSTYICSKCWEYSQSFTHCVYGSGDYNNYSITDHILFEHLKENFIEHFNQSHVRKKGLRRAVKVWIGKAHKVSIKKTKPLLEYDKEKYREMILDAAETVLGFFGFDRSAYSNIKEGRRRKWFEELREQRTRDIESEMI
jgi:hypothetical protein